MTDLLLISDIPRLRKVFKRLGDERDVHLRVATSLEKGAEEMSAEKPTVVFVQTHLSGLSAEILLMHLKKQLGRRRSRFVLLSPPDQVSSEAIKQYHGHLDTTLEDNALFDAAREMISALTAKVKKSAGTVEAFSEVVAEQLEAVQTREAVPVAQATASSDLPAQESSLAAPTVPPRQEPSLEEQGVVYGSRPKLAVYSEFTSSFESAVDSLPSAQEPLEPKRSGQVWNDEYQEIIDADLKKKSSPAKSFLVWLVPVLVIVVVVTVLQHNRSGTKSVEVAPDKQEAATGKKPAPPAAPPQAAKQPQAVSPVVAQPPAPVAAAAPAKPVVSSAAETQKPAGPVPAPTVAEKPAPPHSKAASATAAIRPAKLPDFVPRYGFDKKYGVANPGWERYKGAVTEFKVFREGNSIKAIQVVDRGGRGVPESFMKGAIRQLTSSPSFAVNSSERKDGYEIQRGRLAENLQAVYYRDADGGRLRAFVVTWQ